MSEKNRIKKSPSLWYFIIPALAIIAVWYFWPDLLAWHIGNNDLNNWQTKGTMGDSFGALNTLFSGLAFAALAYTMWMQRTELAETREILSNQKDEAEKQNKTLGQQTFDNTFFQLLRLHNDIVRSIDIVRNSKPTLNGKDCFGFFYTQFKRQQLQIMGMPADSENDLLARICSMYDPFYKTYESDLGHYFRSVYNIIKFVHESKIEIGDKKKYTNLVRAQLSSFELKLLFYNCLSERGRDKFLPLVWRYSLLKHMDHEDNVHGEEDKNLLNSLTANFAL